MPNIGKLFGSPNATVRVIFATINFCEEQQKDACYHVISNNRVEDFKAKCGFDDDRLEMSMMCMMDQRSHHVKLGCCNETPHTI